MKFICKACNIEITNQLKELKDTNMLNEIDGEDYIPLGFYTIGNDICDTFTRINHSGTNKKPEDKIIINIKDLVNYERHSDYTRLNGCCGLDGMDGINTVCINNHEIGTEHSDCWMPHYVSIEPELVKWINK